MKKILILMITAFLVLNSCENFMGPPGADGAEGPEGIGGPPGVVEFRTRYCAVCK